MTILDAPETNVLPTTFLDDVMFLLRRVVVHGEEQELLFKVMDAASRAKAKSTPVQFVR